MNIVISCVYCHKTVSNLARCSVCKEYYCSRACQEADWPRHRKVCKQLSLSVEKMEIRTREILPTYIDMLGDIWKEFLSAQSNIGVRVVADPETIEKTVNGLITPPEYPWKELLVYQNMERVSEKIRDFAVWDPEDHFILTVTPSISEHKFIDSAVLFTPRIPGCELSLLVSDVKLSGLKHILFPNLLSQAEQKLKKVNMVNIYVKITGCVYCDYPLSGNGLHFHQIVNVSDG